ncbi:MAG TPA: hypothetical protein VGH07_03440, partial [Chthoniobacterales bacterium]
MPISHQLFWGQLLGQDVSDHFREAAIGTVRGVGKAKVFEYLQQALLLIEKSEVLGATLRF